MTAFFDTSILVAASERAHPHHERALPLLQKVAHGEHNGFMSAHSIAETYAALTRLPVQPRIQPAEAHRIITENILPHFTIVTLTKEDYAAVLKEMGMRDIPGPEFTTLCSCTAL